MQVLVCVSKLFTLVNDLRIIISRTFFRLWLSTIIPERSLGFISRLFLAWKCTDDLSIWKWRRPLRCVAPFYAFSLELVALALFLVLVKIFLLLVLWLLATTFLLLLLLLLNVSGLSVIFKHKIIHFFTLKITRRNCAREYLFCQITLRRFLSCLSRRNRDIWVKWIKCR